MELSTLSRVNPSVVKISLYASPSFVNWGSSWVANCWTEEEIVGIKELSLSSTSLAFFLASV